VLEKAIKQANQILKEGTSVINTCAGSGFFGGNTLEVFMVGMLTVLK
jgi:predicted methyltransferase